MTGSVANKRTHTKQKAYFLGLEAEDLASQYLQDHFYTIVARRFKVQYGEIDLIALKQNTTVFVEVKARKSLEIGLDAVSFRAWKRIAHAAEIWMIDHPESAKGGWRYDLIAVCSSFISAPVFHHVIDAYRPDW